MSRSEEKAVALKYNPSEDMAPVVIASGYGEVAECIIDIAESRGIPVFRDDSAASVMCMLEVGSAIPQELYEVVAAIYVELLKVADGLKNPNLSAAQKTPAQAQTPPPASPPALPAEGQL